MVAAWGGICASEPPGIVVMINPARQVIGEILDMKIDESALDAEGKPDLQKIGAFAFDVMRMEYYSL